MKKWKRAKELNLVPPAYETGVQPLHLLAVDSCGFHFIGFGSQKHIRTNGFEVHQPRLRDAVMAPLRDGASRHVAQLGNSTCAAEIINDLVCVFAHGCKNLSKLRTDVQAR